MNPANAVQNILRALPSAALATFLALFPIVNPFGAIPIFFSLTGNFPPAEREHTALKTAMELRFCAVVVRIDQTPIDSGNFFRKPVIPGDGLSDLISHMDQMATTWGQYLPAKKVP